MANDRLYFLLGFTSCKAKRPQGMEFQEKGDKDEKHLGELIRKKPKINAYQH